MPLALFETGNRPRPCPAVEYLSFENRSRGCVSLVPFSVVSASHVMLRLIQEKLDIAACVLKKTNKKLRTPDAGCLARCFRILKKTQTKKLFEIYKFRKQGGRIINQLQTSTGTRVKLSQKNEFFPGTHDRVALVQGEDPKMVADAVAEMLRRLREVGSTACVEKGPLSVGGLCETNRVCGWVGAAVLPCEDCWLCFLPLTSSFYGRCCCCCCC